MVLLKVMPHKIQNMTVDILVVIDHGDMFLKLKLLQNRTVLTVFNAFYSRWIATFDAPMHVLVDRRSNLAADLRKVKLDEVEAQLCPTQTRRCRELA